MNDMKKGKIIFNKNVKVIGESAFEGLSTLTSITIPKSIKTIENNAFKDCENLEEMKYNGTVEGWTQIVINSGWKGSENIDFVICSNGNYDYYLVYKVSKMEGDFSDNLKEYLTNNPKFVKRQEPKATGVETKSTTVTKEDGVTAILKAKHPELFED